MSKGVPSVWLKTSGRMAPFWSRLRSRMIPSHLGRLTPFGSRLLMYTSSSREWMEARSEPWPLARQFNRALAKLVWKPPCSAEK